MNYMNCSYCGSRNVEEDHRCLRCGRRLQLADARPSPDGYRSDPYPYSNVATARDLQSLERDSESREELARLPKPPAQPGAIYQRSLFSSKEVPRVLSFGTIITPGLEYQVDEAPTATPVREGTPKSRSRRPAPPNALNYSAQRTFEFPVTSPSPSRTSKTSVDSMVSCDTPVALPAHRVVAAALDASMILFGLAVFLATVYFAGGPIILNQHAVPLIAGITAFLAFLYKMLWCLSGGDSAGMRWTHLRLVNFDGNELDRGQRVYRLLGSCLSFLAAGLGVIWALVDEESLTWHDHMSKTFPTPHHPADPY